MVRIDITGQRFGHWTVMRSVDPPPGGKSAAQWLCKCDCGTIRRIGSNNIRNGKTKSCGCYRVEWSRARAFKHGDTRNRQTSREWRSWQGARRRCYSMNHQDFHNYGGRGIRMCKRWRESFAAFLADMGRCPEGLTLDRRNVNGNYSPKNCRWADSLTQVRNRRNVNPILRRLAR